MSYILDALRRAQAERERGQVPGLEARTMVLPPSPRPQRRAGLLWLGAGLALAGLGIAAVLLLRSDRQPTGGLASAAASGLPAPRPAPQAAQATQAAQTWPPVPLAASAQPVQAPPPMVVVSAPALPASTPAAALPAPGAPLPPASLPPAPAPPPAGLAPVRPTTLAQLSADLRRDLPPLLLGGAIWSDNVSSRFVIVNGQVLREGDTAAPGVVLERIGPKAVFVRWRDWRIELPL
jgi:general secretion pathway protein B